jgi:hypothetical protein
VPGLVSLEPGTPVWLGVDADQLHVFDKHTGSAVRFARTHSPTVAGSNEP